MRSLILLSRPCWETVESMSEGTLRSPEYRHVKRRGAGLLSRVSWICGPTEVLLSGGVEAATRM